MDQPNSSSQSNHISIFLKFERVAQLGVGFVRKFKRKKLEREIGDIIAAIKSYVLSCIIINFSTLVVFQYKNKLIIINRLP